MCKYIYIYVCVYIYMYIYIYIQTYIFGCMYVNMYIYISHNIVCIVQSQVHMRIYIQDLAGSLRSPSKYWSVSMSIVVVRVRGDVKSGQYVAAVHMVMIK